MKTTTYFGYGSNLWRQQMNTRCPTSTFTGLARLNGYRWQCNERGYANIVELPKDKHYVSSAQEHDYTHEVWGLVYELRQADEDKLDVNEGVPVAYTKEYLCCDFWKAPTDGKLPIDISKEAEQKSMLVYINRKQTKDWEPKKEYVYRMNKGIKDALKAGLPEEYVRDVMRKVIPKDEEEGVEGETKKLAMKQALFFEEEDTLAKRTT